VGAQPQEEWATTPTQCISRRAKATRGCGRGDTALSYRPAPPSCSSQETSTNTRSRDSDRSTFIAFIHIVHSSFILHYMRPPSCLPLYSAFTACTTNTIVG
jgi:hypothetical protein